MKRITFKSTQENFKKEYFGLKNNTLRKLEDDDIRKELLIDFELGNLNILTIEIINIKTNESFWRTVTDVTKWEDYYIISWKEVVSFHSSKK